ncbi:metal-dependent protein of the double-stranded beta helix superfamily-like protein [Grimontia sp. AD028]|uniref:Cysteine dioxygenase n=2 Tax=Vibrionaceae TaxID=641 RepID=R1GRE6_9GAMM|nr:hypothetical protein D515_02309 [Grimontia indica]KKD58911.1 metal-dependent protein of the double-stranded beta helix superfamily-like protein [Grimontia sp. AD028]
MSFDLKTLIERCEEALEQENPQQAIKRLLRESLRDPGSVKLALMPGNRADFEFLYESDDLTILHFIWAPKMTMPAHNHNLWAVVGVYEGREDHIFWQKAGDSRFGEADIRAVGAASIAAGEVLSMDNQAIHSVTNPTHLFAAGIHIYGGNFREADRSGWDPILLQETRLDAEKNQAIFDVENEVLDLLERRHK